MELHSVRPALVPLVLFAWIGLAPMIRAQEPDQTTPPARDRAADNTKTNKRDRKQGEPTADQAKNNSSDRELMRKIRRAIVRDKSLSTYAHNVKIVAQDGKVTLKGPVRSEEEKQAVKAKAVEMAGADNVTDELSIKARNSARTN